MAKPWTEGPRELLQHAADHLQLGGDFDRRIALISVDNAVELAIKTYLGLPERSRGSRGPSRRELDAASESFPALVEMLDQFARDKLTTAGVDLGDVEWYHRLRNQLYHSGNGITVDRARVEVYFQIASALFQVLFGEPIRIDQTQATHTRVGEFLRLWAEFDRTLRSKLPPKDDFAYNWKREYFERISGDAADLWDALREFRNQLVHGLSLPPTEEIDRRIEDLRRLHKVIMM